MREALLKALAPREEALEFEGMQLVVRELPETADTTDFADATDNLYRFIVRCTFDVEGHALLSDDDIPLLKATGKARLAPLAMAVARLNGFAKDDEIKNFSAGPSSG